MKSTVTIDATGGKALALFGLITMFNWGCEAPDPAQVAKIGNVRLSDGFRTRGGAFITEQHAVTVFDLVGSSEVLRLVDAQGKKSKAKVINKDETANGGLLYVQDFESQGADLGEAVALEDGDMLTTSLFGEGTEAQPASGALLGWRYHEGKAYLQADFATSDADVGAGVYGPEGTLVGLVAFRRGSKLTFVLPIEYLSSGNKALTAHQFTKSLVGVRDVSQAFAGHIAEGQKHSNPLIDAVDYDALEIEQSYSQSALVGRLTILDKPSSPVGEKPLRYEIEATNAEKKTWVISKGALSPGNQQWFSNEEIKGERAKKLSGAYGEAYVQQNFAPYRYGIIRFRIPFSAYCGKVTENEAHNLTLILADGRKTHQVGFADMVNICHAGEEGDGSTWEKEWGMSSTPGAAKGKAKSKKKKKKRGKKRRRR